MGSQGAARKTGLILLDTFADNLKEMCSLAKKISVVLFFGLLAFPASAFCQVDTAWVRYYNGPGDSTEEAHAMAVDDSGNVYITGWSFGGGTTGMDYVTIKYDRNGNQLWLKRYNGSANSWDYSADIALDRNENIYAAGSALNLGASDDYTIVKYDSQGNQQWVVFYDGPINGADGANALTVDPHCNIYVTGSSDSTNVGGVCASALNFDYVTLKYDSNGNRLWAARYSNPPDYESFAYLIGVDKRGNVYVSGYSYNWCLNHLEWVTVKYDSVGTQQWVQRMDAGLPPLVRQNTPIDMKLGSNGDIYLTGGTMGSATFQDYTTIKYDPQGNQLWMVRFDGNVGGYDYARAMALDSSDNVYVTGFSDAGVEKRSDIVTIKYDLSGNQLWVQSYNGSESGEDRGMAITLDAIGNVYVAGVSLGSNSTYNFVILKYDSNGNFMWEKRFEGPVALYNPTLKISADKDGNIYLAGIHLQNGRDFVTIKYSPLPSLKGDLNLDGVLTMADVVLMLNFAFYGDPFPAAPTAGDLSCNGQISPADFVIMLQIFFLSAPPPC